MAADLRLDGDGRYQLLKVAHERFGCTPGQLDGQQLQQAWRIVERHLQIEDAVLRSPQALGVLIPPELIEQAWAQFGIAYASPTTLYQVLHDCGLDESQVRVLLARELKVEAVLDRVCADQPPLSDTDLSLYYFNHLERFLRPASRQARHILITVNPDYPENVREAALVRIEAIARRLRGKPERFAEQALKHSECPTSLQGGQLGNIKPGMLYPALEACLFDLDVGQIGPVVESPLGFHLLFCEALLPAMQLPLEKVLPYLRETLQARQHKAHQRRWLESLLQPFPPMENQSHG